MTIPIVDLYWLGDPSDLHCPVCGSAIFKMDEAPSMCEHILFTDVDAGDRFDFVHPEIQKLVERALDIAEDDSEDPVAELAKLLDSQSIFILRYTASCGPMGVAASVGIEFQPNSD
jgi:hypothetical protein